jgi:hypothetical protein
VHLSPGARPDLQHVLSMPGFRSQTAYIFAASMSPDSDAVGSACCVDHDAMRRCCRRVCAPSHVARIASLASFAGFTLEADMANQAHRAHAAWLATYAQSAFHADQVDCARLALIAKDSRSAKFASSANPATGKATATADGLQGGRLQQRLGLPRHHRSVFHQPAISSPPPTDAPRITPLVTAFTTSRTGFVGPKTHTVASLISSRSNVPKK